MHWGRLQADSQVVGACPELRVEDTGLAWLGFPQAGGMGTALPPVVLVGITWVAMETCWVVLGDRLETADSESRGSHLGD